MGRTSSTSRTETGREPLNGNPIELPGDGTQPPIEEPSPDDGGRGGGSYNPPTVQERAAWKKQALLDAGADAVLEDQLVARQTITWGADATNSAGYPMYDAYHPDLTLMNEQAKRRDELPMWQDALLDAITYSGLILAASPIIFGLGPELGLSLIHISEPTRPY